MTIGSFTYTPEDITVYFGIGRFAELSAIADEHGLTKMLVLCTASDRAKALAERAVSDGRGPETVSAEASEGNARHGWLSARPSPNTHREALASKHV